MEGERTARRGRVQPTEEWAELEPRLEWPEQVNYELIRPPILYDMSVAERSRQTGASESRLRRGITGFKSYGMRGLFEPEEVEKHSQLDSEVRGLILNLKAEYPPMRPNEIGTVCYVRTGQRPHDRTIRRVLEGQPPAIRMFGRFDSYHNIPDVIERRKAIVTLHAEGWNVKSIAGYLKTSRPTVYRTLDKWFAKGVLGLEDKPRGGVRKVDLKAMNEVRKLQENPELGAFRISAALEQIGIYRSPAPAAGSSPSTANSTGSRSPSAALKRRRKCPSTPRRGTRSGPWTSATSTITWTTRTKSTS